MPEEEEEKKKKKKKNKAARARSLPLTCTRCLVTNEWSYSSTHPARRHGVVRDKFNYSKKMKRR